MIFHFQFSRVSVTPRQHDIARLEVAMDQTLGRGSHQRLRDLDRNFQEPVLHSADHLFARELSKVSPSTNSIA